VIVCSSIAWKYRPEEYAVDGLNSLRYKLAANESRPLYTWLQVELPPLPTYLTGKNIFQVRTSRNNVATRTKRSDALSVMGLTRVKH